MKSGIAFIISHIDVIGTLPQVILPNHTFRRATVPESELIQRRLDSISLPGRGALTSPYRHEVMKEVIDRGFSYSHVPLPSDRWKYWVIAFEGDNCGITELERAAILLPVDFEIGLIQFFSGCQQQGEPTSWICAPLSLVEQYASFHPADVGARDLAVEQILRIGSIVEQIRQLPAEGSFVLRALEDFYSARPLSRRSKLAVVAYFAIIETLITHPPRLAESLDSINHQIANKLILLRKRFSREIPASVYFRAVSEEKLWKLLYKYRSCLAHGEIPDFMSTFEVLNSHGMVEAFMKEIVKELILLGLREPIFLGDLKKC